MTERGRRFRIAWAWARVTIACIWLVLALIYDDRVPLWARVVLVPNVALQVWALEWEKRR